ncbi:MAG: hypothetical protein WCE23_01170 [Candidatus Binatus sp.]|uniref:hypothetical protein n=1 Tax=Candidatus Binatus sp. TaxID=2811406 RepID=UPI003C7843E8
MKQSVRSREMSNALWPLISFVVLLLVIPSDTLSQTAPAIPVPQGGVPVPLVPTDTSKASLKETLSWLEKRLPEFGSFTVETGGQTKIEAIDFESCDLQFEMSDQGWAGVPPSSAPITIKLGHVDPQRISAGKCPNQLDGPHPRGCVRLSSPDLIDLPFYFRDPDSALRVGRALKHAAILCSAGNSTKQTEKQSPIKPLNKLFLLTRDSPVYQNPDEASSTIGHVRRKKLVHVTGITGTYFQVKFKNGTLGFVPMAAAE